MSVQDWIALILAGTALLFAVRWVRKSMTGEAGCGCSSGKSCHATSPSADSIPKATMTPLVQLHTPPTDQPSDESVA